MDSYVKKFLIIFVLLMFATFGLTYGMLALINPNDPNSIYTGIGFFLITFLPLLFGSMWYLKRSANGNSRKEKRLMETGTKAPAEILAIQDTGVTINGLYPIVKLALKVTPTGEAPFETVVETMVSRVDLPRAGDSIRVAYDPAKKSDIMIVKSQA